MLREIVLREFDKYKNELEEVERKKGIDEDKRKNQENSNLTPREKRGLRKIKKRMAGEEIVILKTDKSGKFTVMNRDKYLELGKKNNGGDKVIERGELKTIERKINDHSRMWTKIVNAGEAHNHHSRIKNSKMIESEQAASKYYMYKDHKKGGGFRPVVSG